MNKKVLIFIMVIVGLFFRPYGSYGSGEDKLIILSIEDLATEDIKNMNLDNYVLGLMNIKTRPPYNRENFYLSINTARKLSREDLERGDLSVEYMGDILKNKKLYFLGDKNTHINSLIDGRDLKAQGSREKINYNYSWLANKIDLLMEEMDILALELDFPTRELRTKILGELLESREEKILIISRGQEEDTLSPNMGLVLYSDKESKGLIISQSTKRDGILALEDLGPSIENFFQEDRGNKIGKNLDIKKVGNPQEELGRIIQDLRIVFILSIIGHGLIFLGIFALFLNLIFQELKIANRLLLLGFINIIVSLILGGIYRKLPISIYIALNVLLVLLGLVLVNRERRFIDLGVVLTYVLLGLGLIFKEDIIYYSYIGYNNIGYGARFYGLNNGAAGVLLGSSLYIIARMDSGIKKQSLKTFLILGLGLINIVLMSTGFASNTGGFITGIIIIIGLVYNYIFMEKLNLFRSLVFLGVSLGIFALNLYIDEITSGGGHALSFIKRVFDYGLGEFIYMAKFKMLELIKFTLLPPFSLVIICQAYIISRLYREDRTNKLMIISSLGGFFINDTGNILLIYILFYLILKLYFERKERLGYYRK